MDQFDTLLKVPPEVVRAAVTLSNWVNGHMAGYHNIRVYGVGVRTFLSIEAMLMERSLEERISELRE